MARMHHKGLLCLGTAAIAACIVSPQVRAQEIGDKENGRAFAIKHCAECHAVVTDKSFSPNPGAPSFLSVANTKGMSGRALAAWIDSSHPTMPNFVLHRDDRDDVVAYILSLKKASPPN